LSTNIMSRLLSWRPHHLPDENFWDA
jgi:hypothetical protein